MYHDAIYTVGHSNRETVELIGLLRAAGITGIVDVRRWPHSRRFPRFSHDRLRDALSEAEVTYDWAGEALGGGRAPRTPTAHPALKEDAMRGYADHMRDPGFARGAQGLIARCSRERVALMCAERLPGHCHRSLIADYLWVHGVRVVHLIGPGETREHALSPVARIGAGGELIYDRNATGELDLWR